MDKKTKQTIIVLLCVAGVIFATVAALLVYMLFPAAEPSDGELTLPPPTAPDPATVVRSPSITGEFTYAEVVKERSLSIKLVGEVWADGYPLAYDKSENIYYLSVADESIGEFTGISFSAYDKAGNPLDIVFEEEIDKYSYFKPQNNKKYFMRVYDDGKYANVSMIITTMPFLVIDTDGKSIGRDADTNCTITLRDGNWKEHGSAPVTVSEAVIHTRGASSASFPKKAYKFSLRESDYETNRNLSLLGLRNDDDYVLDAMYIDPTRMHNKLATEIWNGMSSEYNASDGEYVEVILNGQYMGLYDLIEPIDQKQLGLDEENGLLIKTPGWDGTRFEMYAPKPTGATWMGFEIKYPKENVTVRSWGYFCELVYATVNYSNSRIGFLNSTDFYDHQNLTDYWLWLTVYSLRDNRGKNLYWSTVDITDPDGVYLITPWDCDLSFGYRYGATDTTLLNLPHHRDHYENDYMDDFMLLTRYIGSDVNGAKATIEERWEELSAEGGVMNLDSVKARIEYYRGYLVETGAWNREKKRWPDAMNPDSNEEFQYMYDWLDGRYEWMEQRIYDVVYGNALK